MAEQQVWRVAVHARGPVGVWTLCRPRFPNQVQAEEYAGAALAAGASNARVYPEVNGTVHLPSWMALREDDEDADDARTEGAAR